MPRRKKPFKHNIMNMSLLYSVLPKKIKIDLLSGTIEGQCLKMIIAIWTKLKLIISQRCKDDYEVNSQKSIPYKWSWYTP